MDLISAGPFRAGSLAWRTRHGHSMLTVICKCTYVLLEGQSRLAEEQEYINEEDNHWNDDPARSVYSPSDMAPYKTRADIMVVGHAFAPRGETVRALTARIVVGEVDKSIDVYGERSFSHDGAMREGARFSKMPLRYERAAGGPDTTNPVGIRMDGRMDAYGNIILPNLQPPGRLISSLSDIIEPIGFGPISAAWPYRIGKLGRYAPQWTGDYAALNPIPDDIDPSFFNAAPADQQAHELRDNERIVLDYLHPDHPHLVTSLPGQHPQAFVVRPGKPVTELALKADTLWIDTDRSICTLTYRAQIELEHPAEQGHIIMALAQPGQRLSWAAVNSMVMASEAIGDSEDLNEITVDAMPESEPGTEQLRFKPIPAGGALPFVSQDSGAPKDLKGQRLQRQTEPPPPPPPLHAEGEFHVDTAVGMKKFSDASPPWLSGASAAPPSAAPVLTAPLPAPSNPGFAAPSNPGFAAPPMIPAPPLSSAGVPVPPRVESPWASKSSNLQNKSTDVPIGPSAQVLPPPPPVPVVSPLSAPPSRISSPGLPAMTPAAIAAATAIGVQGGATSASNAAASASNWSVLPADSPAPSASPVPEKRFQVRPGGREVVDLLWFDSKDVPRIREQEAWKPIIAAAKAKKPAKDKSNDFDDPFEDAPSRSPEQEKEYEERRDVYSVLTKAPTMDIEGINEAIADAVSEDGTFVRPLVAVSGELTFPFDELEMLKATVTAVTPFMAGDKKLKDTVDTVNELLKTPWIQSGTGVAEGLTVRVREAFSQANRNLPPNYLESHTERILLEQRHYQKRTVFGELWIRSLFSLPGTSQALPAYLPESLSKKLPMFQTMRVRLIAEAHLQQDQYETQPSALKVIAMGRAASLSTGLTPGRGAASKGT